MDLSRLTPSALNPMPRMATKHSQQTPGTLPYRPPSSSSSSISHNAATPVSPSPQPTLKTHPTRITQTPRPIRASSPLVSDPDPTSMTTTHRFPPLIRMARRLHRQRSLTFPTFNRTFGFRDELVPSFSDDLHVFFGRGFAPWEREVEGWVEVGVDVGSEGEEGRVD
jgi:hypothetical protein